MNKLVAKLETRVLSPQAIADDAAGVALLTREQLREGKRCLHADFEVSPEALRAENAAQKSYVVVHNEAAEVVGLMGVEISDEVGRAWLRGPFVDLDFATSFEDVSNAAFNALREHTGARATLWDAFIEVEHERAMRWYAHRGFVNRMRHSVYTHSGGSFAADAFAGVEVLRPEQIDDVVALAAKEFPGGYLTRNDFAAPASDTAIVFAASDGARLLGYVYASYEAGAIEAQVDNIAVAPDARKKGIGRKLLLAALHWAFNARSAPQVALVMTEGNVNAQPLYESVGFELLARGQHLRLDERRVDA